tara:strand:- start:841 stop:2073 length:1233 start_codon:yes stop_codon:yes gene_type:complete
MFCKKPWTNDYLYQVLPKAFVNTDLKKTREKVLFDREIAQMPATQPAVEQQIYIENQHQKKAEIHKKIKDLQKELVDTWLNIQRGNKPSHDQAPSFIRKCPHENCKGFLGQDWSCALCNSVVCKHCNEIIGEDHECNPDNVATANLLKKDTKPCPSCGEMIFKIHGCDQMYCTTCHTAFSWNRGTIETGAVHNPHYFEWRRLNGNNQREAGDFECGGLPRFDNIGMYDNITKSNTLTLIYQRVSDIQNVALIRLRPRPVNNESLRIDYMRNKITTDQFMKKLQQIEKKNQKDNEVYQILRMLSDTLCEYLRQIDSALQSNPVFIETTDDRYIIKNFFTARDEYIKATAIRGFRGRDPTLWKQMWNSGDKRIDAAIASMNELRIYANSHFKKISDHMNMQVKTINTTWSFV